MITQVKLQNLSEIKIGWFCVALFEGTSPLEDASTLTVCLGKKKLGSTSPCIYIPVLLKYLHLFSLSKQKSFADLLNLAVTGKLGSMFLTIFGKNKWSESQNHR